MKQFFLLLVLSTTISFANVQKDSISHQELKIIQFEEEIEDLKTELERQQKEYQNLINATKENNDLIYDKADKRLTYLIWAIGIIAGVLGLLIRFVGKDAISKYFDETAKDFTKDKINSIITEEWLKNEVEEKAQIPINEAIKGLREKFKKDSAKLIKSMDTLRKQYESSLESLKAKESKKGIGRIENAEVKKELLAFEEGLKSTKNEGQYTATDWYYQGKADYEEGQLKDALKAFEASIELDSKDADAWAWRGYIFGELKKYKEGIVSYDKAIELNPDYAGALYNNRGNAKDSLNQYEEAIKDYNKAIELDPNDAEIYSNRGATKSNLNQYEEAIKDYNKAIELNPDYAPAYYNRGNAKENLNQYEQAIKDYKKAIELDPNDAEIYYNRGNAKESLNQHEDAIKDYNKAIELDPNDAEIYYNRGVAKSNLNQYEEAIKDYNKAIELDPNDAEIYNNRGVAKSNLNQYEEAIKDYNKAIELDSNYAKAHYNKGNAKENLDQYEEAIKDYNKAIELNPNDAEIYNNRGVAKSNLNQHEKAIK
uniref:tetratricopeptide repeat protein n=1 Tax=uncultured Croceitalea sp. TaxID=1798908 RepID=UPI003306554E